MKGALLVSLFIIIIFSNYLQAQNVCKRKMLKATWQLVQTTVQGKNHVIGKEDYDDVYKIKCWGNYIEHIQYEGMSPIIKGKWKFNNKECSLQFIKRKYVRHSQGNTLEDVRLSIEKLNKEELVVKGVEKGEPFLIYYKKVHK